ncbi:hypothetical protein [Moraxella lacunata]
MWCVLYREILIRQAFFMKFLKFSKIKCFLGFGIAFLGAVA